MAPGLFYDEIYKQNFYLFIGWSEKDYVNYCSKKLNVHIKVTGRGGQTMTFYLDDDTMIIVVFVSESGAKKDIAGFLGNIAHECVHAVNYVFERIGHDQDVRNDEPQAYYVGTLVEKCLNYYYKKGKKK